MPATDLGTGAELKRSKSVSTIPHSSNQHTAEVPVPIKTTHRISCTLPQGTSTTEKRWTRSIPEAGYIRLGSLRYGVRLSNNRFSGGFETLHPRNSDSIDTCTILLHPTSSQALNDESLTFRSCCVGFANGRCCAGCLGNMAPRIQPRRQLGKAASTKTSRQQRPPHFGVTRLAFPKNRTSTLSPSRTGTTSWCSSSSAVSAPVSPTISIRSASSAAHQSEVGVANHRLADRDLSSIGVSRQSCFEARCQANPCRERAKLKTHPNRQPQPERGRSLSTEEIKTIGCFNLKSLAVNKSTATAPSAQCNTKATGKLEKPAWLQICDPCHRILERSLTPDSSDTVLLRNSGVNGRESKTSDNLNNTHHRYLDLAGFNYIDSSSLCGGDHSNSDHLEVVDRTRIFEYTASEVNNICTDFERNIQIKNVHTCEVPPLNGQWLKNNKNNVVTVNNILESPYLCKDDDSFKNIIGVDDIIINSKVLRHEAQQTSLEEETEGQSFVANNNLNLGEKERVDIDIESKWWSRNAIVANDHRCFHPEVEQATPLEQPRQDSNLKCDNDSHEQKNDCVTDTDKANGNDIVQSDCFETDYEKCIESINRQLNLESRDAVNRRTAATVRVSGPDPHSKEEAKMDKRRNTFDRFPRWSFGQRSASNNDLASGEQKKKDTSERLKELTELLKGTRIPSLSGFNSSCSPPPVPPPRRQRCGLSVEKSFEKGESIEVKGETDCKVVQRKKSVPSMKINEPEVLPPDQTLPGKPLHISISSPHFRSLLEKSQPPHTTDCNDIPFRAEELFSLPKVEPKTIIGSYAQKNIPYRSASFSQVDFSSGKYSLGRPESRQHPKENRNSTSVVDNSSSTYPRRRGDLRLLRNMKLSSPGPKSDHDHAIAEESSPEHENRRTSILATIESYEIEESISEDTEVQPSDEIVIASRVGDNVATGVNEADSDSKVPMLLYKVTESKNGEDKLDFGVADLKALQTACVIPTPVFECCGKEVETLTEWFQLEHTTDDTTPGKDFPTVAISACAVPKSPSISESLDLSRVEVRKRNTFSSDSGNSKQSSLEQYDDGPAEERRKIDKSKRRKGIYIQWPVTEKSPSENSWDIDSPDCEVEDKGQLKLNVKLGINFDCLSTASCEPLTPDSDNCLPRWPKKNNSRNVNLTYQSSDEKDDPPKEGSRKSGNLLRMDSTSDNESDRAQKPISPSHSRDDLKRYSKRPLRGPYGQMLEAEMKKASKVHYTEILDDLRPAAELKTSPRPGRSNLSHSLDESAKSPSKSPTPRKTSAHLPIPFHERAASTPNQIDHQADEVGLFVVQKKFPNSVEKLYYDAPPTKKLSDPGGKLLRSTFHSEVMLSAIPQTTSPMNSKPCKRTASGFMDRSSHKRGEKANFTDGISRKHSSEIVDTPRGPVASNDLLAELLMGSSEKHNHQNLPPKGGIVNSSPTPTKTLPQAVLKCLDTRTHVVIELFNTEQSYVDSLNTVISKYLNPLKSSDNLRDIVDTQLVDEIFYMVPSILGIHERFLEELHKRLGAWDCNQKVGDAFIDVFSSSSVVEIYTCFVNNWNKAKNAIRLACAAKPAFARFLESMAREHKGKLSLDNLLIKPVQKFPNYELILSRLIKHTDSNHPDQSLLQDANRLVHTILMHLNCKEREALENGQREATLRELEVVIEGITDLVHGDRTFLLFDVVSMFSGQTTRKERGLFLFSDIMVIASIKKRTGTIKKPNTSYATTVAATLDTNKYKFLTKMPLSELEIAKAKDESVRKMMREIEHLSEDHAKIQKIMDIMNSIRIPHQILEESMRELQKDVQRQLSERQANDTQLSILEFNLFSSDINQNVSILFSKPEKRNQWEETFSSTKLRLATTFEKNTAPEFLTMIPIRKTRAGLQFTCAASTIGSMNDVWVCNSDGYVGQVCVLSLYPEPTVTSCNGVCNARILCVTSVPPSSHTEPSSHESIGVSEQLNQSPEEVDRAPVRGTPDTRIQLDSSSSSDNESDIEFCGQLNASAFGGSLNPIGDVSHDSLKDQSPAAATQGNVSSTTSLAKSEAEEMDRTQSTMWLGTEDGCVHVYNCTDNIRIKKNKIKIQHSSAVYSILYLDNRVFVSLANGDICVYLRDNAGWSTGNPITISVGTVTSPVTKLLNVHGRIWCAIQGTIKVLNVQQLQIEGQIQISTESKPITNLATSTNCVWVTIQNSSIIKCYHSTGHELLFEIDVSNPVNKMLSTCDDIIRQHKSACLRITSLLACKDLLWIGTSAGVLLNLPVGNSTKGLQHIVSSLTGINYGHTGHVRFLTSVELSCSSVTGRPSSSSLSKLGTNPTSINIAARKSPTTLVISGGDGYEDFRSSTANSGNDVAGREDSTNHLLLWQI